MKSIILFNRKDMTYAVVGMNYTDEEASAEMEKVKDLGGFTVDQQGRVYSLETELEVRMNEITKGRVMRVPM